MEINSLISPSVKPVAEPTVSAPVDEDGFGFDDFLDVINPLQHVPVIGSLYRAITGDHIEAPAQLAGGAIFGGLNGFLGALGSLAYEGIAGESFEQTIFSLFDSDEPAAPMQATRAYQTAQAMSVDDIERASFIGTGPGKPINLAELGQNF